MMRADVRPQSSPILYRDQTAARLSRSWTSSNNEINAGLADPKLRARLVELGGTIYPLSPADFGKFIAEDTDKWSKVIKAINIKAG